MDGIEGTTIGSGIAWTWEKKAEYGIVAETHGYTDKKAMLEILEWKIMEMAKIREIDIGEINYRTEAMRVPMDAYGCVIAALVYLPQTCQ
jgi:arginine decarboxylase